MRRGVLQQTVTLKPDFGKTSIFARDRSGLDPLDRVTVRELVVIFAVLIRTQQGSRLRLWSLNIPNDWSALAGSHFGHPQKGRQIKVILIDCHELIR